MIARQWIIEHCGAQVSSLRRASPIELLRQRLGFVFHAGELGVIDYNGGGHVNRSLLNIVLHDLVLLTGHRGAEAAAHCDRINSCLLILPLEQF
jgi:hypothetical protein